MSRINWIHWRQTGEERQKELNCTGDHSSRPLCGNGDYYAKVTDALNDVTCPLCLRTIRLEAPPVYSGNWNNADWRKHITYDRRWMTSTLKVKELLDGGSISHATLRTADLLEAFSNVWQKLDPIGHCYDAEEIEGHLKNPDSEAASEFLNEVMFDKLNEFAPDGYYFGAHMGDGSDFGYWKHEEEELRASYTGICDWCSKHFTDSDYPNHCSGAHYRAFHFSD